MSEGVDLVTQAAFEREVKEASPLASPVTPLHLLPTPVPEAPTLPGLSGPDRRIPHSQLQLQMQTSQSLSEIASFTKVVHGAQSRMEESQGRIDDLLGRMEESQSRMEERMDDRMDRIETGLAADQKENEELKKRIDSIEKASARPPH